MKQATLLLSAALWASVSAAQVPSGPSAASIPGPAGPSGPSAARDGGSARQAPSVLRTYDLGAVLPRFDQPDARQQSLVVAPGMSWFFGNEETDETDRNRALEADVDLVVDLLTQILGDDLRLEGREIDSQRQGELVVLAPEEVQAKVQAVLSALARSLAAQSVVTVDILESSAVDALEWPSSATITAAEADRLVTSSAARGAAHASYSFVLTPGRTASSNQTRTRGLLCDYDVEIAQGAATWDPIMSSVEEGHRLQLRGIPTAEGLRLAAITRSVALVGEVVDRPLHNSMLLTGGDKPGWAYLAGPKSVQKVEVVDMAFAFSGYLTPSTALVCASRLNVAGVQRSELVVLRLASSQGGVSMRTTLDQGPRSLIAVNTDLLSPPTIRSFFTGEEWPEGQDLFPSLYARIDSEPSLFLLDWMKYRFSVWRSLGPWAIVVSDPAWDRDAPEALGALLAGMSVAAKVDSLELTLASGGGLEGSPVSVLLPVVAGEPAAAVAGTVKNGIWDYDVEVAQHCAVADPVPYALFSGIQLRVRTGTSEDGRRSVDLSGQALVPAAPTEVHEVDAPGFRYFDEESIDRLRFEQRVSLTADGMARIGAQAKGMPRAALRLEVRVR